MVITTNAGYWRDLIWEDKENELFDKQFKRIVDDIVKLSGGKIARWRVGLVKASPKGASVKFSPVKLRK